MIKAGKIGTNDDQTPRWLSGSTTRQVFVATLCSASDINDALTVFDEVLGHIPILRREIYDRHACAITIECRPDEAREVLKTLRLRLDATDAYLQPESASPIRLLMCDMDMTMVASETLDEVAEQLGMGERIAAITTRAMHGEIDFDDALRERIDLLKGQPEQVFYDVTSQLKLNPGATELINAAKAAGVYCVLISGGFAQVAQPIAERLGFDEVYCNHLDVVGGLLTGTVHDPIVNAAYKCNALHRTARARGHGLDACCAIGDGANDLPMLRAAGLGIAYRAKPILHAASACHIDYTDLDSAIHFMRLSTKRS